ncbi:Carbohydrate binding module (family 6) [Flaviramulus basaltis]|uniref:Carbohydrate binding module (Family 6) n=1 Tax=Flaviramulus basaltis TaxID=369401 RepID=A0A1K2IRP0_9FLAO|nr:carbohydrate-binding protein [Flaviramulus basaltis]SFZ95039.1 Carbohydrate binding module (family 6) [Flaviramulus basaltis]
MILKKIQKIKSYYLTGLILFGLLSCEDEIREVTLYEKGNIEASTSSTNITVDESISYQDLSTKVQSITWAFEGGNPSTSFNSNVDVTYNESGVYITTLEVKFIDNQIEKKEYTIEVYPLAIVPQNPFSGSPKPTETKIQFEDFDFGGESISYHDTDSNNDGNSNYRFGHGVDIETTNDESGNFDITNITDGEWLEYTIFVETASIYDINFKLLAETNGSSIIVQRVNGTNVTDLGDTGAITSTDGVYTTVTAENVNLEAGQHVLRMLFSGSGIKANYFEIINTIYIPPVEKFGIYTENTDLVGSTPIQLQVNNQFAINTITDDPYEGTKALSFTIDGSADWAMASIIPDTPVDISSYVNYNVALKSTSNGTILIRLQGGGQRGIISLDAASEPYGFKRDGNWHLISIPLTDFLADNPALNLSSITDLMVLRSSPDDVRNANNYDFYLDNFYLSR